MMQAFQVGRKAGSQITQLQSEKMLSAPPLLSRIECFRRVHERMALVVGGEGGGFDEDALEEVGGGFVAADPGAP